MLAAIHLAALLAVAAVPGGPDDPTGMLRIYPRANTWDLTADVGCARGPSCGAQVRTGVLLIREPWFVGVGPGYRVTDDSRAAFGLEVEVTDVVAGWWAQGGGWYDVTRAVPMIRGAAGFSLFGVEVAQDLGARHRTRVAAMLHVPVRILLHLFESRPRSRQ